MLPPVQDLALDAVQTVKQDLGNGQSEIDIKNYAKIEKIPGGTIEDCKVRLTAADIMPWGRICAHLHIHSLVQRVYTGAVGLGCGRETYEWQTTVLWSCC